MAENQTGREEEQEPTLRKLDPKALAIVLVFGVVLVLLIALNMN